MEQAKKSKLHRRLTSVIMIVIILTVASFSGCTGENTTNTTADKTITEENTLMTEENTTFCGYQIELSGGAGVKDGVLSSEKKGTGLVDLGGVTKYAVSFNVRLTDRNGGGVNLLYIDEDNYYRLNLGPRWHTATLSRKQNGNLEVIKTSNCNVTSDCEVNVRITVSGTLLRIYIDDGGEYKDIAKFDVYVPAGYTKNGKRIMLDCANGTVSYSGFALEEITGKTDVGKSYINPVHENSADPYILVDNGTYYLYATNAVMEGYRVYTSKDLKNWSGGSLCLRTADVYGAPTSSAGFWAPEVYRAGEKYYLVYTVAEHIGIAVSDSPTGPFKSPISRYLVSHSAIDPTLFFDDDGKVYLYYVGWGSVSYGIYGREINLETYELGEEKPILKPDSGTWETKEGSVTEGPFMLKHDGTYYLTYSGNGYQSKYYAVGYATSSDPLSGFWKYSNNPILSQLPSNEVYGPGHHAFFTTPGGELMIVYHRHFSSTAVHARTACLDRAVFVKYPDEKIARLEILGPTSSYQPLPDIS